MLSLQPAVLITGRRNIFRMVSEFYFEDLLRKVVEYAMINDTNSRL